MSFLKVMMSSSPTTPDLPPHSSVLSLTFSELENDQTRNFGSMNIDDLLKNIYGDTEPFPADYGSGGDESVPWQGSFSLPKNVGSKTVDEVWKEISGGRREQEMTLEDFLTKAGAVREEEVRLPVIQPEAPGLGADSMMNIASQFEAPALLRLPRSGTGGFCVESAGFGNRIDGRGGGGSGCNGGGRGKRRLVEEPVDKATQQKQRRMIKNRESAARSRERKQAYTVELESLVTQLGEENAKLLREEAKQTKERFKQLMENVIPVVEERRPRRALGRMRSM